jgi:long-subunit fatty acid transport protein
MITLVIMAGLVVASCVAAAGLIASTQNSADATRAVSGPEFGPDVDV